MNLGNIDDHLLGWTPVAHYKGVKKFLKRLIYGRRYSKPADRLFQDYYWRAWSKKNKPVGGLVPSMPPFIQEMGTEVVISKDALSLHYTSRTKEAEEEWAYLFDGLGRFIYHATGPRETFAKRAYVNAWIHERHISRDEAYRHADEYISKHVGRDWSTDPYASWDPHKKDCKSCVHNNNVSYCSENCNWDHREYVEVVEVYPQAVLTFDFSVPPQKIDEISKKLKDPKNKVRYSNPAGGIWLPAGTKYTLLQELTNK